MNKDELYKILDKIAHWRLDSDVNLGTGPGRNRAEQGLFPVFESYLDPESDCTWCDKTCSLPQIIRYNRIKHTWELNCKECGEKRIIRRMKKTKTK